jgi:hypothetical protein
MDSIVIDGVPLIIYPERGLQGRWSFQCDADDIGVFGTVVDQILEGRHPGWVEGIRARKALHAPQYAYASPSSTRPGGEPWPYAAIRWSSLGGSVEGDDCYLLGVPTLQDPEFLIPAPALIELLTVLLERSGLDPKETPSVLGPFDPNADYARLPRPPDRPPPPLNKNKNRLVEINGRIRRLESLQREDPVAAHTMRVALLAEMKEMGFFREELITSRDASRLNQSKVSELLSCLEELRSYYQSAYRKESLGTTSMPNAIGGPLSYQFIDQTRSWKFHDDHPHEIFARLEAQMLKLSNLEGDFGKRRVEDGTFKATFHWEREDGIHASLIRVDIESW